MSSKKSFVEIARAIGIVLVVIGHSITKSMTQQSYLADVSRLFIYTIHMPLFIFLSGFLFECNIEKYLKSPATSFLKNKFCSLMLPYFSFSIINYAIVAVGLHVPKVSSVLLTQGYKLDGVLPSFVSIITYENHLDGHLWFCYLLFLILLINRIFLKNNSTKGFVILLLLNYANYLITYVYGVNAIPDMAHRVLHYLFIFSAGRLSVTQEERISQDRWRILIAGVCAFFIMLLFRAFDLVILQRLITPFVEISFSCFLMFGLAKIVDSASGVTVVKLKEKLLSVGSSRITFALYLIHMPFILSGMVYLLDKIGAPTFLNVIISSIVGACVSVLLYTKILSKIKIVDKIGFGNWKISGDKK